MAAVLPKTWSHAQGEMEGNRPIAFPSQEAGQHFCHTSIFLIRNTEYD